MLARELNSIPKCSLNFGYGWLCREGFSWMVSHHAAALAERTS
jgi:hypothetical protein